ncbi:GNAT family N-acetyltransferase [Amycolatopsis sp. NBC_00345]|uniref:GNAT family N-acetyltransferase n=1 Tax=Amycolatopsis sp. NBC_00345 TaxID=2975955 RepID=UPI002E253878
MNGTTVRTLRTDEHRAASSLFRGALHLPPNTDAEWAGAALAYQPGGAIGAFDPDLIGTSRSFDAELTVPGGARLPAAGISGVGVRPDRTRRGVLRAMMTAQLEDFAARGVAFACLGASEAGIYGRFGFGLAGRRRTYEVDRHRARLTPGVPAGGRVELLDAGDATGVLPAVYDRIAHRPGMMTRPDVVWRLYEDLARREPAPVKTVVHHGPDGPDGYACYTVTTEQERPKTRTLKLTDLVTGTPDAFAGLWRFLLGADLVDRIVAGSRPLDEPIELILADHRVSQVTLIEDDHWVRLVDVPEALAAREYGAARPVVVAVDDPLLPANTGPYRITSDGAVRTDEPAALRCDAATLAMAYLGGWRLSALAGAGRVEVRDPAALPDADALFATRRPSWAGSYF